MSIKNENLHLIKRARSTYVEKVELCNYHKMIPLTIMEFNEIEAELTIFLSDDFKEINQLFDYEYIGNFEWLNFSLKDQQSVLFETKQFRQNLHLPHRYVVLSNPGDTWVVLMETQDSSEKQSPVICLAPEDLDNLIENKPLEYDHIIWPSFTDFFEYLVEEEEAAIQKEIK